MCGVTNRLRLPKLQNQDTWVIDVLRDISAYLDRSGYEEGKGSIADAISVISQEMRWREISILARGDLTIHGDSNVSNGQIAAPLLDPMDQHSKPEC